MIERQLLKKYCPSGEWLNIPRLPTNQPIKARMSLPMSIRCHTCGNDIYKRTKCNSRKEVCIGETYLGIQKYRFHFKCTRCSAEITLKLDPQHSGYTVESGASRIEHWGEEINGSSESVLNPTDVLRKTDGPESANKEGSIAAAVTPVYGELP